MQIRVGRVLLGQLDAGDAEGPHVADIGVPAGATKGRDKRVPPWLHSGGSAKRARNMEE